LCPATTILTYREQMILLIGF